MAALRFYFAFTLLAAFLSIYSCLILWKRRHSGLGRVSFLLVLAVTLWLVPNVFILLVGDLPASIIFFKVGFIGAFSMPVTWLMYAVFLIGKEAWINTRRIIISMLIPLFLFVLVVTDQYWRGISLVQLEWLSSLEVNYSGWLNLWMVFSYTLDGLGILLIIWSMIRFPRKNWWRGLAIVAGVLFPILANVAFYFNLIPGLRVDLTPFSILFPVLIIIWGSFRYQWFDVVPVARDALVDRVADSMLVLDASGQVLDLNLAARRILGVTLSQARFKPLEDLLPEMKPLMREGEGMVAGKKELTIERGGRINHYEIALTPMVNRGGDAAGTLVVLHDITERKQGEMQLKEALDKEKALAETRSRFVAVASHAFRTPLTAIKSSVDLLKAYSDRWPEEKREEHLVRIRQSVSEMIDLLKRMLAYEELQSGKIQVKAAELDLVALCNRVIRELPVDRGGRGALHFEKHGKSFQAAQDEALLYQVLTNLLSNAFKYSPPGSPVRLELWVEGLNARIEVSDQGIGIPAKDLPHLGEAFFRGSNTSNTPGSGLGLLIVKRALQMMGGELQVESSERSGTRVQATFPLQLRA